MKATAIATATLTATPMTPTPQALPVKNPARKRPRVSLVELAMVPKSMTRSVPGDEVPSVNRPADKWLPSVGNKKSS